jgi:beta-N-acetylhexosaminidase
LITVDQEGGGVTRLKPPEWLAWPNGVVFDRLYDLAPASAIEAARANAQALGQDLAEVGITCTHAPVLDVRQPGTHDVIGDRAYGSDPMRVAAIGRAVLDGLARAGIAGTIKHMPGHGRAGADSHLELPTVTASDAELETDIAPFRALNQTPMAMTAHIVFTAWDAQRPATQSPFVIEEIIRGRIGFDGLLMTDDLDMQALSGAVPERAAKSIAAGCDVALNCWAKMDDMVGMAQALPALSQKGATRLQNALHGTQEAAKAPTGQAELLAKRDALLALVEAAA